MNYVVRKLTGNFTRWPSAKTLLKSPYSKRYTKLGSTRMDLKSFIIKVIEIVKGTLIGKVILSLITGGLTLLGAAPFFDKYISAVFESYLGLKAEDPSTYIGLSLIVVGVALAIWERKNLLSLERAKIGNNTINDKVEKQLSESQFISFKNEVEQNCLNIINRLIEKHHNFDDSPEHILNLGKRALYGDKQATTQYVDSVMVGNCPDDYKIKFLMMRRDATGQPIIYKFLKSYQSLLNRSKTEGFQDLVKGTPLYQVYSNVTHPAFLKLRKQAYWEDFV